MTSRAPRIAMVVFDDATHDSRVRKCAASAAAAGCEVLVVGVSSGRDRWETRMGPVRFARLPLLGAAPRAERLFGRAGYATHAAYRHALERRGGSRAVRLRRWASDGLILAGVRSRALTRLDPAGARSGWREIYPEIERLARAAAPVIAAFEPDVVHAHDFPALPAGARGAAAAAGAALVYDAHEYVAGMEFSPPARQRAIEALEAEHVPACDRVVTVAPITAALLEQRYGLARRPDVILNAPVLAARPRRAAGGLRRAAGVPAGAPVIVYTGHVKPLRGLDTVVEALPALAGVHLVLVTDDEFGHVSTLRARAAALGAAERLHRLPYVASHEVSGFIADATLGVSALRRYGNAEATLPNKVFEYLHAGLPVAVSDNRPTRELLDGLGVGELFTPGDPEAFARAAGAILAGPEPYRRAVAGVLETFSWERQAAHLLAAYAELLPADVVLAEPEPARVAGILAA